jgi:hypothetical protein
MDWEREIIACGVGPIPTGSRQRYSVSVRHKNAEEEVTIIVTVSSNLDPAAQKKAAISRAKALAQLFPGLW